MPFRLLCAGRQSGSDQSTAAGDSVTVTPRPILADRAEIKTVKAPVRTRLKKSLKLWTPLLSMDAIYYNPASTDVFSGVSNLARKTGVTNKRALEWLRYRDASTLHKPQRKRFQRRRFIVAGIDSQWQIDLVDLQKLKKENEGQRYLFTCIDVFSKFAWALPIKDKTGKATAAALKSIIVTSGRKPKDIVMDKGSEFLNITFLQFLKTQSIRSFTKENAETKAAVIERWHRTLINKMFRYFTKKTRQYRYLDVLQDLVRS